jgi:hypothetical protein
MHSPTVREHAMGLIHSGLNDSERPLRIGGG